MKRELDERIADWVDGRLPPRDLERLEAEFRVNGSLRRAAEEYRRSVEHVRRALAKPEPSVDLADRVLEKIQLRRAGPRLGKMLPMVASVAAAAAMVLLFVTLNQLEPAGDGSLRTTARANPEPADSPVPVLLEEITDADRSVNANQPRRESEFAARAQAGAERQELALTRSEDELRDKLVEQADEVGAMRKAGAVAEDVRLRIDNEADGEVAGKVDIAGEREIPEPAGPPASVATPDGMASFPLDETTVWVQSVIGDATVQAVDVQKQANPTEQENLRLGEGLPSLGEDRASMNRRDVEPSTPVVVIDLPPGQDLKTAALGRAIVGGVTPSSEEKSIAEDSRTTQLKNQLLQETLEQALLPVTNATPPAVDEIDSNGLVVLQGTLNFDDRAKDLVQMGYAQGLSADISAGRGFLVQGERQQVAAFLRQMTDWGRAQGGQVGIAQVAESIVEQAQLQQAQLQPAQLPGEAGAGGERDVNRRQRRLLQSLPVVPELGARRGGRGRPAAPTVEEISVVLLFRSAR